MTREEYQEEYEQWLNDLANEEYYEQQKQRLLGMDLRDVISLLPDEKEEEFRKEVMEKGDITLLDLMDFLTKQEYEQMVEEIYDEIIRLGLLK